IGGEVQRFAMPGATRIGAEALQLATNGAGTFAPDGAIVVAGQASISLADPETGAVTNRPHALLRGGVSYVAASPDDRLLAVGGFHGDLFLYDLPQLTPHGGPLLGHDNALNSLRFNSDGSKLASSS